MVSVTKPIHNSVGPGSLILGPSFWGENKIFKISPFGKVVFEQNFIFPMMVMCHGTGDNLVLN